MVMVCVRSLLNMNLTIANVRNIPIRLHVTVLLVPLLAMLTFGGSHGALGAWFGLALAGLLLLSVVLHELGHSLAAQRYGIAVRNITLYPFGGVAFLEKGSRDPKHELWIALAGPAVNAMIALIIGGVAAAVGMVPGPPALEPTVASAVQWVVAANLMLCFFNLIPALPLDGGRVLRALLELKLGRERATLIASAVAKVVAVAMGVWAILGGQLILGALAVMIFFGARAEVVGDQIRLGLAGRRAGDLYNRSPLTLAPGDGIHTAVDLILSSPQKEFAVVLGNQLLGVLTREHVMAYLERGESSQSVARAMVKTFPRCDQHVAADELREQLSISETRVAGVFDGDRFLGLVSLDDLHEAAMILSASRAGARVALRS